MQVGRQWSIAETFQREYELAGKFLSHPDFDEGVSARLINKPPTTPVWNPASLDGVSERDVDEMFQPEAGAKKLALIDTGVGDYSEYPLSMGLPKEAEVEEVVRQGAKRRAGVVKQFWRATKQKVGVREKVEEVLGRCCEEDEQGFLMWVATDGDQERSVEADEFFKQEG